MLDDRGVCTELCATAQLRSGALLVGIIRSQALIAPINVASSPAFAMSCAP